MIYLNEKFQQFFLVLEKMESYQHLFLELEQM